MSEYTRKPAIGINLVNHHRSNLVNTNSLNVLMSELRRLSEEVVAEAGVPFGELTHIVMSITQDQTTIAGAFKLSVTAAKRLD